MPTQTVKELSIKYKNPETALKVLETFPSEIIYADLHFLANGLDLEMDEDFREYLNQCENKGVIPLSSAKFAYNNFDGKFEPEREEILRGVVEEEISTSITRLIQGGKINRLHFDSRGISPAGNGFDKFRQDILPHLREQGYELDIADLWITSYRHTGYDSGQSKCDGLFVKGRYKRLDLTVGSKTDEQDTREIVEWFNSFR